MTESTPGTGGADKERPSDKEYPNVIVAGHICLDIIPLFSHMPLGFSSSPADPSPFFLPGSLVKVGPAILSTGGPVSNTGLVLHKLGISTTLVAKIGADLFGQAILQIITSMDPSLAQGLVTELGSTTSYTVIISPPGLDRMFLHCPGANDTFGKDDLPYDRLKTFDLLHFGYPPLMKRIYQHNGGELLQIFQWAKAAGLTTSLDMSMPDPLAESGQVNWSLLLQAVLPYTDLFLPSLEETLFMLDRPAFESTRLVGGTSDWITAHPQAISHLGHRLLDMGARIVLLKLGDCGAYLCTADQDRLESLGRGHPENTVAWANRELWAPCFRVRVAGTTGSGDSTIAGFISALLRGLSPEGALTAAVATGAHNVEAADALSGITSWYKILARIGTGWERLVQGTPPHDWHWIPQAGLWAAPNDLASQAAYPE
jgi:sugar/nucleoside kinase (ribokinase family)